MLARLLVTLCRRPPAPRFLLVTLRLFAARGFPPSRAKPGPAGRALGFFPRSGPSARLTPAPRFLLVTLRLFAARGFPPSRAKPGPAGQALGFCPRSGPSARLTTALRF